MEQYSREEILNIVEEEDVDSKFLLEDELQQLYAIFE